MENGQRNDRIRVADLHKSFGRQTVLQGVALTVRGGETLAVMGRSGTGKSVLLKLLVGLQRPDSGKVSINGQTIGELQPAQLNEVRKKVGFLFQGAALYDSMTIEENVIFPMARHGRGSASEQKGRARELLANLGMDKDLAKYPSEVSGGMQKRVGLARALALDPEILLFDEPTAGLDPITASEISKLILDLKRTRGMTAVVVTHDLRGARTFADRIVLLHEGRLVAEGKLDDLQASKDTFVSEFLRNAA